MNQKSKLVHSFFSTTLSFPVSNIMWRGVAPEVLHSVCIITMRQTSQHHCLGELKHNAGNAVPDCTTRYNNKNYSKLPTMDRVTTGS